LVSCVLKYASSLSHHAPWTRKKILREK